MDEKTWARAGAASGFAMVALAAAASVFERTPVTPADYAANRTALLTQSMLFLAGGAAGLWFLGSLRMHLSRAEGGFGRVSGVAFGAGTAWVALNMLAQAFQVGTARDAAEAVPVMSINTMNAVFTVANLPLVVMLLAVAVVSLRHRAFPPWLGWLAAVSAGAQTLLWMATVVESGPLAANGWLSLALYPFFVLWLLPATAIMVRQA
ncbi:hypothetical protein [Paractinoplanes rishiriensis]|uniref:DUF4386 family protein n=1 Tax=Paractinoplanes rishiriensis TaxID=1050105 RepID=A0A919KB14_9ACTN|nr:hypothetical protein [Actinoplanes rishiriensis]GIF02176.1 hypothetical protein Ari01nite_96400 [Actinoplanes rishiriensis]